MTTLKDAVFSTPTFSFQELLTENLKPEKETSVMSLETCEQSPDASPERQPSELLEAWKTIKSWLKKADIEILLRSKSSSPNDDAQTDLYLDKLSMAHTLASHDRQPKRRDQNEHDPLKQHLDANLSTQRVRNRSPARSCDMDSIVACSEFSTPAKAMECAFSVDEEPTSVSEMVVFSDCGDAASREIYPDEKPSPSLQNDVIAYADTMWTNMKESEDRWVEAQKKVCDLVASVNSYKMKLLTANMTITELELRIQESDMVHKKTFDLLEVSKQELIRVYRRGEDTLKRVRSREVEKTKEIHRLLVLLQEEKDKNEHLKTQLQDALRALFKDTNEASPPKKEVLHQKESTGDGIIASLNESNARRASTTEPASSRPSSQQQPVLLTPYS